MVETRAQHRRRVTWDGVESDRGVFSDILSRLSVRSIRSVKTVNKYWYGSVRDKHFATMHLAQSRKKPTYIACPRVDNAMNLYLLKPGKFKFQHHATVDPPGRSADHHMHMIASFNGLVCCINQLSDEYEVDYQIWICNPSTEQTLLLPQGRPSFWTEPSIGVAYGPDISEYKIFRIFSDGEKNAGEGLLVECEVYSSITGAWRRSIGSVPHLPMYNYFIPHRSGHVFVGGKIYWLVSLEDPGLILSVDMEERFEVMELPHYPKGLREEDRITICTYLIDLGGSLSLVVLHGEYFDIWEWKEASWELEERDELPDMDYEIVSSVTSSEKEILFVTGSDLWTYHLNIRKWKRRDRPPTRSIYPATFPFTESLLPCNGGVRLEGR
ncbi:F-box family protein-related [Raphanus sativus]|uniref:F-box protein At5g49610 n=1 Tax=Raphanus sativus TaxID=3726 RepID=A0A9W3DTS2_RAPSA|nr:F-box protein At5g49610 [Raphanus sativus]XP_056867099.1 F-box protein At5g49610 [Raphanus sativus]XP_056867100.1 F-box protein At5g49610 [Raphanus sativus]KAJ4894148.1 F-box family protein-related [Raphanus sativus]